MGKGRADLPPLPCIGRATMTDSEKLDLILKEYRRNEEGY